MLGLMQETPLEIRVLVRHAERLHSRKRVATRTSNGIAVATWGEVIERARRLVSALRGLGVREGERVATFSWNHQQHLEAYLAVPLMGAVLHTLNIRLFDHDLAYIVEHAEDRVVIVDRSLLPAWEKVRARLPAGLVRHTIVVDDGPGPDHAGALDYEKLLAASAPAAELPVVPENQAAAMCYTSGTTGRPKGVVYSHRSTVLHALVASTPGALDVRERDVILPIVPMFHANAWGIPYIALLAGSDLALPGRFLQPEPLVELMAERRVTFAAGVPSIWIALEEPLQRARERLALGQILCGGSAVPPALQKSYREKLGVSILHAWGMTETSPLASVCRAGACHDGLGPDELAPILATQGRPAPGVELRLVGEDGAEVPWDGQRPGEIQVRGPWVARAYHHDDTSSEKFQDGWLRTGDVATIDANGYIRITDRTKDLVKSGGEWISSVELEGAIMGHPEVQEAAVIAIAHPKWCERPLACVVAKPRAKGTLTRDSILEWLRPRVARWWLPDDVVFIDEVPKTSVGKFDKKVLRERFKAHVLPE